MPLIYLETLIKAPPALVFDLCRSVDLHKYSMTRYNEKIIEGIGTGLMNKGDIVTWQARHLFRSRRLKVKLTEVSTPHFFADEMVEGNFSKMKHEHYFKPSGEGTCMVDQFYFASPFGLLGQLVNYLFLKKYMIRLLAERNREIKRIAESDQWKQFLQP